MRSNQWSIDAIPKGSTCSIGRFEPEPVASRVSGHADGANDSCFSPPPGPANVAAETVTVADVAALARGEQPVGGATHTFASPFQYEHRLSEYMR